MRFDVAPSEAIDYFRRKKVLPSKEFYDIRGEARSAAFTVSGVYKQDVLEAFRLEIENALANGTTRQSVVKNFKAILAGAGHKELGDFHLETVARTNMMMAYGVGRRRQMEEAAGLLPFWQYNAVGDDRTRPTHRALDGVILPVDNPFWDDHFPPWGFRCRCSVSAILDQPKDYNPTKPNDDATIAYDENGVPVKVEIGTAVHDLSAGKFVGVPPQNKLRAGLKETIENSQSEIKKAKLRASRNPDERERLTETIKDANPSRESLTILKNAPFADKIEDLQKQMRAFKREHALVFDRPGELIHYKIGEAAEVEINLNAEQSRRAVGGSLLHNHPDNEQFAASDPRRDGGGFSPEDFITAATYQIEELFGVSREFKYYTFPNSGKWDERMLDAVDFQTPDGSIKEMSRFESDYTYYFNRSYKELSDKINRTTYKTAAGLELARMLRFRQAEQKAFEILSNLYDFAYLRFK